MRELKIVAVLCAKVFARKERKFRPRRSLLIQNPLLLACLLMTADIIIIFNNCLSPAAATDF